MFIFSHVSSCVIFNVLFISIAKVSVEFGISLRQHLCVCVCLFFIVLYLSQCSDTDLNIQMPQAICAISVLVCPGNANEG